MIIMTPIPKNDFLAIDLIVTVCLIGFKGLGLDLGHPALPAYRPDLTTPAEGGNPVASLLTLARESHLGWHVYYDTDRRFPKQKKQKTFMVI